MNVKCPDCGKSGIKTKALVFHRAAHKRWAKKSNVQKLVDSNGNGHPFKDAVKAEIVHVRGEISRLGKYVLQLEMLETK